MTLAEPAQNGLAPRVNALTDKHIPLPAQTEESSLLPVLGRNGNGQGAGYHELLKMLAPGDNVSSSESPDLSQLAPAGRLNGSCNSTGIVELVDRNQTDKTLVINVIDIKGILIGNTP